MPITSDMLKFHRGNKTSFYYLYIEFASEYLADYNAIKRQLQQLIPINKDVLGKLTGFLKDITKAWGKAVQYHRNRLCKYLLESIWLKDKMIIGVAPQPEFIPFFDLQYDGSPNYTLEVRPRGGSRFNAISQCRALSGVGTT